MLKITSQFNKKLSKGPVRYRVFLGPVLVGLIVALLSFWVVVPKLTDIISGQRAIRSERQKLAKLTEKLASLEGLNEYELSNKTEKVMKVLPSEKDLPASLKAIRSLVDSVGLTLEEIKIKPGAVSGSSSSDKPSDEELPNLAFNVVISGSREKVKEVLGQIKVTMPLMKPGDMVVASQEKVNCRATLDWLVFYLPFPATLGSVESPLPKITSEEDKVFQNLSHFKAETDKEILAPAPVRVGKENPFSF